MAGSPSVPSSDSSSGPLAIPSDTPPVAIIGAGAVGAALAHRLKAVGYRIEAIISRTAGPAEELATDVEAAVVSTAPDDLPPAVRIVLCCVPDDQIPDLAASLAGLPLRWPARLVAHTSGALTSDALAPLAEAGAPVLSFHPMQTFTASSPPDIFKGIYIGLEGDAHALPTGRQVAEALGARPVTLSKEQKAGYHLAGSMASNFMVTLVALAGEVLSTAGVDQGEGTVLLQPLVEGTARNLAGASPGSALTGPIARGDNSTVATHLETLQTHRADLLPVYVALATETVHLATRAGRLSSETATLLLDRLEEALRSSERTIP